MSRRAFEPDIFILGGGPAGLAAAIRASEAGFRVLLADHVRPPIDKACGEGLMPDAAAGLSGLGVQLEPGMAVPFRGVRFIDDQTGISVAAAFPYGTGLGLRRTVLHAKLVQRAAEAGVSFAWDARVTALGCGYVACNGRPVSSRWVIGADGQNSLVGKWVAARPLRRKPMRFGFRRHFRVAPWSDFVEVYWGRTCQITVTPIGLEEIGAAVTSRNPHIRLQSALDEAPSLAERLRNVPATSAERGAPCALRRLSRVHRERFALVGDASGSVDPVTGEGIGLAFQQAAALAGALRKNDLRAYQDAHDRIGRRSRLFSRLILTMDAHPWLRKRVLRALAAEPGIFASLLDMRLQSFPQLSGGLASMLRLGLRIAGPYGSNRGADI